MRFSSDHPMYRYSTPVKYLHGCQIMLDPLSGKFAAMIGLQVIERKDMASVEREITKRASREPQRAMSLASDNVRFFDVATEETKRGRGRYAHNGKLYRTTSGELLERALYVADDKLAAEYEQLRKDRQAANKAFDDRQYQLSKRLVPFVFEVKPIKTPEPAKPVWQELPGEQPASLSPFRAAGREFVEQHRPALDMLAPYDGPVAPGVDSEPATAGDGAESYGG